MNTDVFGEDWPDMKEEFLHQLRWCETVFRDLKDNRKANMLARWRLEVMKL